MVLSKRIVGELQADLQTREKEGRLINEVVFDGPQGPRIKLAGGQEVINLCSNDYLGLANDPDVCGVAATAMARSGFGLAAGRIISGTQSAHLDLEGAVSSFLRTADTLLYTSCFDANVGLFQALLGPEDVVLSDTLNHASIIDGIRLCQAHRYTYPSRDLAALRRLLEDCGGARRRLVVTDGVFSMDGEIADVAAICDLAGEYDAIVVVDDSHGTGVIGDRGRGTVGADDVRGRVDLVTGTFGKALGGAGGGFTSGRQELIDTLRQESRPYVFSNAMSPAMVAVANYVLGRLETDDSLLRRLRDKVQLMRRLLRDRGFQVPSGQHPIIPIVLGDDGRAKRIAAFMFEAGIFAVALTHPVVPRDGARIRLQVSGAHEPDDLVLVADVLREAVTANTR